MEASLKVHVYLETEAYFDFEVQLFELREVVAVDSFRVPGPCKIFTPVEAESVLSKLVASK